MNIFQTQFLSYVPNQIVYLQKTMIIIWRIKKKSSPTTGSSINRIGYYRVVQRKKDVFFGDIHKNGMDTAYTMNIQKKGK